MTDTDEVLILPVPELLGAAYLVPTMSRPPDCRDLVADRLDNRFAEYLRSAIREWLDLPGTPISVHSVRDHPLPPIELLAAGARATSDQIERVAKATHYVLVAAHGRPGGPPGFEWVARGAATLIAEALSADVIDPLSYEVLSAQHAGDSMPDEDGQFRLADWVTVEYSPDRHGYWCTTNGLRRFGLPELQTLITPPNVVEQWGSAMSGIAVALVDTFNRVLAENPQAAFVEIPSRLEVSTHDVAAAYGMPRAERQVAAMRLTLDPTGPERHSFLTIHPPLDWSGSAGEHIAEACALLFGARRMNVRHATQSDAMDRAIATAREGLPRIRSRFESNQLDLHTKLLIKYALPTDDGIEYLWAYVTSWSVPARILATSADAAVYDSTVRPGRPVVVDQDAIVDWAVEHDELGIIEGGWTQAALDDD